MGASGLATVVRIGKRTAVAAEGDAVAHAPRRRNAPAAPPPAAVTAAGVELEVPGYIQLTATEKRIFRDLCASLPAHLHKQIDAAAVSELAQVIREMEALQRVIRKHGAFEKVTLQHGEVRIVERAHAKRLNQLSKRRARLMDQLGLSTPKRAKLAPNSTRPKKGIDRWGAGQ